MRTFFYSLSFAIFAVTAGFQAQAIVPGDVPLTTVISTGLSGPVGIFNAGDGSGRLFVIQQGGAARVIRNNALITTPFFTIGGATTCRHSVGDSLQTVGFTVASERGLLGLAFHPNYALNGHVFASFTDNSGDSMIVRFTAAVPSADVLSANDLATCLVIFRADQDFTNHNGGNILFGPDGFLYFGLGDGGSGNDPCNRGQTLSPTQLPGTDGNNSACPADPPFTSGTAANIRGNANSRALLGKIVRLDINGTTPAGSNELCASMVDGAANYAIPASNPYIGVDGNQVCDETFIFGVRNPWRFSFDRSNGDLFIGDVGQDRWEEVNLLPAGTAAGANLDWKICEGTRATGTCNTACSNGSPNRIIFDYHNTGNGCTAAGIRSGISVTGGFRYRGPDALLQGVYFYGDAGQSELWFSEFNGSSWMPPQAGTPSATTVTGLNGAIYTFGEDEGGALYFNAGNQIVRIGGVALLDILFRDGFEQ